MAFEEKIEIHNGLWSSHIVKPSMVLPKQAGIWLRLGGCIIGSVQVDELAAAMIDIVRNGSGGKIWQNAEIVMRGRSVIK